ncbi:hypothetical protein V8C42DRAFT_129073 [Trichoderma barbatum]
MLHLRSVSDPPLASPSTPSFWELPALANRPVTPLAPRPDNADAYVKRPLPPLPPPMLMNPAVIPPPLKISKRKNKPAALSVGPGSDNAPHVEAEAEARIASPRQSPRTPVRNAHPARLSSLPSPVASLKHRKSKKVLQLMGHDVDVTNLVGITPQEAAKEAIARSSRSFDDAATANPTTLLQLPEEGLVPVLEDDDGMTSLSSKKSSWGPGSPHSASAFPLTSQNSVRRRRSARIFDQDGLSHLAAQEDAFMPSNEESEQGDESDDEMAAGEYHKFAVELAASAVPKTSIDEANHPSESIGRRSSVLSFKSGSRFSRLRRRPTTADPQSKRVGSSSSTEAASQVPPVPPVPATPETEEPFVPKSAFEESDSDSDRPSSRSRWRRDRSSNKEDRGRDSPALGRRDDESSISRGWAKTGDQVNRLLTVGRRRNKQEIGAVSESVFA